MDIKSVATFIKGRMNKSVDERLIPQGEYIDAMNVRLGATETTEIGAVENTRGNEQITQLRFNSVLLSNQAKCIGAYEDSMNETMYWFVHDPANPQSPETDKVDLVVSYNTVTNQVTYHVESVSVLNFDPAYLITGVNLIDNLLFWTDDKNPPRKIDVRRNYPTPSGGFDQLVEEDVSVVRKPPGFQDLDNITSPTVKLINLASEENYMEDRFLSFAYRYRYEDQEYSATSLFTTPAFEPGVFEFSYENFSNESMQNKYNAAEVSFNTGSRRVIAVDILFKYTNSTTIFLIERFDKVNEGWADNTTHTITFTNSKIYTVLGNDEILRLYDNVPKLAKAQTIMANRLIYGNYTDGYNITNATGQVLDLEYYLQRVTSSVGVYSVDFPVLSSGITYQINTNVSPVTIPNSKATWDLASIAGNLTAGSQFSLRMSLTTYQVQAYAVDNALGTIVTCVGDNDPATGCTGWEQEAVTTNVDIECFIDLSQDYTGPTAVFDFINSTEFANAIGTIAPPTPNANIETMANAAQGFSLTDSFNTETIAPVNYTKYNSSIDNSSNQQGVRITPPATTTDTTFGLQNLAIEYQYNNVGTGYTIHSFEYFTITSTDIDIINVTEQGSLHSNRDYEVGLVYMDEYARASTVLVAQFNTIFIPPSGSDLINKIKVELFSRPPSWAKRWKYVVKPSATNYETIYTNFFVKALDGSIWFLLRGDNTEKVKVGQQLIVKIDADGAQNNEIKAEVLAAEAQEINFIDPRPDPADSTVKSPAGFYMNMVPQQWRVSDDAVPQTWWNPNGFGKTTSGNVCTPGSTTAQGWWYDEDYVIEGNNGVKTNIPINAGAQITITLHVWRNESNSGNTESIEYNYKQTFTAAQNFANLYLWWVAAQPDLGSGTNTGNGDYDDVFFETTLSSKAAYDLGSSCTGAFGLNIYVPPCRDNNNPMTSANCPQGQWYGNIQFVADNPLVDGSPIYLCYRPGLSGTAARTARSRLSVDVTQGGDLIVFETEPNEANSEIFYDSSVSYPIVAGQHASGSEVANGTVTSVNGSELNDTTGIFSVSVQVGDFVYNTTTGATATVTVVNSNIQLTLDTPIFTTPGEAYVIIHTDNSADQNQTAAGSPSILTIPFFNCYSFGNGVESYKIQDRLDGMSFQLGERALAVSNQDFKEANRFAGVTYSGIFSGESNQNNLNEFNLGLVNFKDLETHFGEIQVLHARKTDILVLQEDRISYVLAGKNILTDAVGGGTVTSVPEVLGEQVARLEEYGNSFNPESFISYGYDMYFTDAKRGAVLKLRGSSFNTDELVVISSEGMRSWFRDQFQVSLTTQKLGGFDPYMDEYVLGTNDIQVPFPDPPVPCGTIIADIDCSGITSYTVDVGSIIGSVVVTLTLFTGSGGCSLTAVWNGVPQTISPTGAGVYTITINKTSATPDTISLELTPSGICNYEIVVDCPVEKTITIVQVGLNTINDANKLLHCQMGWSNAQSTSPILSNQMIFGSDSTIASLYYLEQGIRSTGYFPYDGANLIVQTNKIFQDNYDFDTATDTLKWFSSNTLYGNNATDIAALLGQSLNSLVVTQPSTNVFRGIQNSATIPDANEYLYLIYDFRTIADQYLCYSNISLSDACCNCTIPCTSITLSEPQTSSLLACNMVRNQTYYFIGQGATPVVGDLLFNAAGCESSATAISGYYGTNSGTYLVVDANGVITQISNC
tara:strand:- start:5410 stop:10500 length:5091 start_codon:yes stop_codon:yes gene_type:complete